MAIEAVEFASTLPVSAEEAYAWHGRPGAFERLIPPWAPVRVIEQSGDLAHREVILEAVIGPVRRRWVTKTLGAVPGRQFMDQHTGGPFARWLHTRLFEPVDQTRCRCVDRIEYQLPFGAAGSLAGGWVRRSLERVLRYQHTTLSHDLHAHQRFSAQGSRTILMTGATGLVGRGLLCYLTAGGYRVRRLVRRQPGPDDLRWDPAGGQLESAGLQGVDAVVHLAGESIAGGRWTAAHRRRVMESRTKGTALLARALAQLPRPPRVLVSASAIGIYGDHGQEVLTEQAPLRVEGEAGFLERVAQAWEAATAPAEQAGIRVIRLRMGMVLTPAGGALEKMLPPFRAGLGGRLGNGRQYVSWIAIDDVVGSIHHAILTESITGPVNATAPEPVTNAELTATLSRVLSRPSLLPVPAAVLRAVFGTMAEELLLASTRVIPERLQASGYPFRFPAVEGALRHVLGR
ncbi:MAG TPA: TIGR01777 family oxidoreductase [Gemmatimonadales bacterium]|jgi:hypothetical protein